MIRNHATRTRGDSQPVTGCVGNHPHSSGNRWKHRQAHRPVNGFMGAVISLLTHGTTWQIPLMDLKFILTHMHTQFYMFGSAAQWEHSYAFTQSTESADTQKSTSLSKYTINVLINNIMWHVTTSFSHLHCINLSGSVTPGLQFYFKKSAWTKWSIFNFSYNFGFQLILEQEQKFVSAHFSFTFSRKVQTLPPPGCGITASVHTDLLI